MKLLKRTLETFLLLSLYILLWILLTEEFSPAQLVSGAVFSALAILFTNRVLLRADYRRDYSFRPLTSLLYLFLLIIQIYIAGFTTLALLFKKRPPVALYTYQSSLDDSLPLCFLANAVTLTPGTVTADMQQGKLTILCFQDGGTSLPAGICRSLRQFERILAPPLRRSR